MKQMRNLADYNLFCGLRVIYPKYNSFLPFQRVHEPLSHLIITERCQYQHMWHIYEMLQRTNSRIPPKFLELLMDFRGVSVQVVL